MRILLDENFPLVLQRELVRTGVEAEHIVLGPKRGLSDSEIVARLRAEALLFLTQDTDFLDAPRPLAAVILVSRIPQSLPLAVRVQAWMRGIAEYLESRPHGLIFELVPPGTVRSVP